MKNRLICLALCLVFVLSVCLTGCADKTSEEMIDNIVAEASANTKTLSMWLVVEEMPSDAVKASITNAINEITTSKFNTYMFINFLTEEQYYSTVSEEIRAYEDSRNSFAPADTSASEDIVVGNGQFAKRYPGLRNHQVDIVYIAGQDMYAEYIGNGWLSSLDSELSASSKKIKEYISSTLLEAAKLEGATYAIPNNNAIGEYTYMLLDKDLMEKTFTSGIYDQGKIDGFFNEYIFYYLEDVYKHYPDVLPIDATYEECLDLLAHYWSIDPETYEAVDNGLSVLGYRYTDPKTLSKGKTTLDFNSLFADETFCENFVKLNEYRLEGGYFGKAAEGDKAAIRFITGDFSYYEKFINESFSEEEKSNDEKLSGNYYPVIVKYPSVDVDDVFESMFGVCAYSVDLAASMQIVTYLNTNADFRNLLQYGVLGEHYKLVENEDGDKVVERLTDDDDNILYSMDIFKTGNAFIAYPDTYMTQDVWETAKNQNREALIEPLLNFDFAKIVKDSDAADDFSVKVGSTGYAYTYESGYSKEVASQNALLKKWIDKSDAAGKGVYVLHTGVLSGQNFTGKIYYYNNNVTNAEVAVTDGNGALTVNYSGTAGEGSDITVITFNGKKNSSNLAWNATVNGTAANTVVTYQNSLLNFDFFNTEYYTVDFDSKITKAMIVDNEAIWNWISQGSHSNDKPNVAVFNGTVGEGENAKSKSTYVVYLPKITNAYTVSAQPTVSGTTLNLNIAYNKGTSALGDADVKYAIFMINVTMEAPMTAVQFNLSIDGKAATDAVTTELVEDPKIAISGTLDVELVKYFDSLNKDVNEMLNACDDIEKFEALVNDLHVLLTPISEESILKEGLSHVTGKLSTDTLKSYVEGKDLEQFYWMLSCATSKDGVVHLTLDENDSDSGVVKTKELDANPATAERYHYYSSPYALYVGWLKANGYAK